MTVLTVEKLFVQMNRTRQGNGKPAGGHKLAKNGLPDAAPSQIGLESTLMKITRTIFILLDQHAAIIENRRVM